MLALTSGVNAGPVDWSGWRPAIPADFTATYNKVADAALKAGKVKNRTCYPTSCQVDLVWVSDVAFVLHDITTKDGINYQILCWNSDAAIPPKNDDYCWSSEGHLWRERYDAASKQWVNYGDIAWNYPAATPAAPPPTPVTRAPSGPKGGPEGPEVPGPSAKMTVEPVVGAGSSTTDYLALRDSTRGGGLLTDVMVGHFGVEMMVDTGATGGLSLTADVANRLLTSGWASETGTANICLANGQCEKERQIVINDVMVGIHTLHNVTATVGAGAGAPMLLSLDVLNAIGPFKVDVKNHKITFG
jgi:hypothetical protein